MNNPTLVEEINKNMAVALPDEITLDELQATLTVHINELIQTDFQKRITILYRIDVSESKLKGLLKHNPEEDAGKIIASLVIKRQLQKIESRKHFSQKSDNAED